jgi:hypothetical protein
MGSKEIVHLYAFHCIMCYDIAEILLKLVLNSNQSVNQSTVSLIKMKHKIYHIVRTIPKSN